VALSLAISRDRESDLAGTAGTARCSSLSLHTALLARQARYTSPALALLVSSVTRTRLARALIVSLIAATRCPSSACRRSCATMAGVTHCSIFAETRFCPNLARCPYYHENYDCLNNVKGIPCKYGAECIFAHRLPPPASSSSSSASGRWLASPPRHMPPAAASHYEFRERNERDWEWERERERERREQFDRDREHNNRERERDWEWERARGRERDRAMPRDWERPPPPEYRGGGGGASPPRRHYQREPSPRSSHYYAPVSGAPGPLFERGRSSYDAHGWGAPSHRYQHEPPPDTRMPSVHVSARDYGGESQRDVMPGPSLGKRSREREWQGAYGHPHEREIMFEKRQKTSASRSVRSHSRSSIDDEADERRRSHSASGYSNGREVEKSNAEQRGAHDDSREEPLPYPWVKYTSRSSGVDFYYHPETKERTWVRPVAASTTASATATSTDGDADTDAADTRRRSSSSSRTSPSSSTRSSDKRADAKSSSREHSSSSKQRSSKENAGTSKVKRERERERERASSSTHTRTNSVPREKDEPQHTDAHEQAKEPTSSSARSRDTKEPLKEQASSLSRASSSRTRNEPAASDKARRSGHGDTKAVASTSSSAVTTTTDADADADANADAKSLSSSSAAVYSSDNVIGMMPIVDRLLPEKLAAVVKHVRQGRGTDRPSAGHTERSSSLRTEDESWCLSCSSQLFDGIPHDVPLDRVCARCRPIIVRLLSRCLDRLGSVMMLMPWLCVQQMREHKSTARRFGIPLKAEAVE